MRENLPRPFGKIKGVEILNFKKCIKEYKHFTNIKVTKRAGSTRPSKEEIRTEITMKAIYPGNFDPITYGHIDIIKRAARIFDRVIVAVAHNTEKEPLFSLEERVSMLKRATSNIPSVKVDDFAGLAVEYVSKSGTNVLIRGLRMVSDFV